MTGIAGMGTTFGLPNYVGELFHLTPETTPLLSLIGGLTGGKKADATTFTWQTDDLRNAGQNTQLEGAVAPQADNRVRSVVSNVVEIHQEKASVSYTKQSATGAINTMNTASGVQPVQNELDYQVANKIKEIARDVEFSFINGQYQQPSDNTTARKTRGLLQAVQTNLIQVAPQNAGTGLSAATTVITETSTPVSNGDKVIFTDVGASPTLVAGRTYYVVAKGTNQFSVASSAGGSAINIGTATVSYSRPATSTTLSTDFYNTLFQMVYDNGGLEEGDLATIIVNSTQKRNLSKTYASAYGQFHETSRTVGGVNFTTIESDVATFNVMLDRFMPADALLVTSLEQLTPVFLEVPNKGHFFEEPLAKVGASDEVQIYGEIGLEYGKETAHGLYRGLPLL
ncbi:SU10 major capsid protein [Leifsonia sp. P73]|uniref:SU10 major capsid protein n=1 Tax=Leifsonia sp. P73 TaxID=3423959 RepID=UPI003DA4FFCE